MRASVHAEIPNKLRVIVEILTNDDFNAVESHVLRSRLAPYGLQTDYLQLGFDSLELRIGGN
jgi:hypothetical protein